MSAELHELRRLRKRQAFPIPASACAIFDAFDVSPEQVGKPSFRLRTRRCGVEITFGIHLGSGNAFSWNVSEMLGIWPSNFAEARKWAHAYAAGFGHTIDEVVRPRERPPTGADAKLFRAGGCREAWLESDVPKLFAEAAVRCQHPGGFCMSDGFCHYGDCDMEMLDGVSSQAFS